MKKLPKMPQKIRKKQLKRMDMCFSLMTSFLILGVLLSSYLVIGLSVVFMGLYIWGFYSLRCPTCGGLIYPWVVQKAIKEDVSCPGCGFKLNIE